MKVIISEKVFERLERSLIFLKENLDYSPSSIKKLRKKLFSRAHELSNHPRLGQIEEYLEELDEGHRRIIEGHFKIIYFIEDNHIYITDFFDTRQNPSKVRG